MDLAAFDLARKEFLRRKPPALPDPWRDGALLPTCLVDLKSYVADCTNATTATCKGRDGHVLQVTICAAPPPAVSHVCAFCPGLDHAVFAVEPAVVASDADLLLLRVAFGPTSAAERVSENDYYLYHAKGSPLGGPSLRLLPHPGCFFGDVHVGILSYHKHSHSHSGSVLRPHRPASYVIAALRYESDRSRPDRYELHLLHSDASSWSKPRLVLPPPQDHKPCGFQFTKVINLGGEGGTMGWVDLWQGILFCDVLRRTNVVRYVPVPPPISPTNRLTGDPRVTRDIAVIRGRVRYLELQTRIVPGSATKGNYTADGWTIATWTRTSSDPFKEDWRHECTLDASQVSLQNQNSPMCLELLPKLVVDDQGTPQPSLMRLHTEHPTLSTHDDDTVYIMTKVIYHNENAWVLAIDMRDKTLQAVAEFCVNRKLCRSYTFMQSGISEHLDMVAGSKAYLKRQGKPLPGSSLKKHLGIHTMDEEPLPSWFVERQQLSGKSENHMDDDMVDS